MKGEQQITLDPHGELAAQITLDLHGNRAARGERGRGEFRSEKRSEEPDGERRAGTERAGMTNWVSNGKVGQIEESG